MSGSENSIMAGEDGIFIDRNSFDRIWSVLICPTIEDYSNRFSDIVVSDNAKEAIWREYENFNRHCKTRYMQDPNGKIDRHKVCACYMYAIVKASVMRCNLAGSDTEQKYLALNENLAITVGLSLLRAFILASVSNSESLSPEEKELRSAKVDGGIVFPDCNHGVYRENFAAELHYTNNERNYNILSLANTLFLLEIHTLETDVINDQNKKKKQKENEKTPTKRKRIPTQNRVRV